MWLCAAAADTNAHTDTSFNGFIAKGKKYVLWWLHSVQRSKNDFIMHKLATSKCPQGLLMIIKLVYFTNFAEYAKGVFFCRFILWIFFCKHSCKQKLCGYCNVNAKNCIVLWRFGLDLWTHKTTTTTTTKFYCQKHFINLLWFFLSCLISVWFRWIPTWQSCR